MDLWFVAGLVMLVVWAIGTFSHTAAPGWIHLLLTLGVFLMIWRVVVRGTRGASAPPPPRTPGGPRTRG